MNPTPPNLAPLQETNPFVSNEGGTNSEIDLRGLLRALRRREPLILACLIISVALAFVFLTQVTPKYTSTSLILIDQRTQQVVDVEAVVSGLPPDSAVVDSEVEVLRSRSIAERAVAKLNLVKDPEFNPTLSDSKLSSMLKTVTGAIGSLFGTGADNALPDWLAGVNSGAAPSLSGRDPDEVAMSKTVDAFMKNLVIERKRLTYVIKLAYESDDPIKAALIANTVSDLYVVEQLDAKFEATRRANAWLTERLSGLRDQVEQSERAVEIYRAENDLQEARGITINEQQLSELNAQIIIARAELAETQAKYTQVSSLVRSGRDPQSIAEVLESPTISKLREQQALVIRRDAELSSKYGERHPQIINIRAERRDLETQVEQEVKRIVTNMQSEVNVAYSRLRSLTASMEELRSDATVNNEASVRLRQLEREATANRTLYDEFLGRFKETKGQEDIATSDSRVISRAQPPTVASFPNKPLILGVAAVLGLILGGLLAFAAEAMDAGFKTVQQVESETGLAVLSSIPHLGRTDRWHERALLSPQDFVIDRPMSPFGEAVRSLRTAVQLSNIDDPPKVLGVTSSVPGEGKSTTAMCMARSSALSGARTLLIDVDLRQPRITLAMGLEPTQGLTDVLLGRVSLQEAVIPDHKVEGLDVLPVVKTAPSPPDMIRSKQMHDLIMQARQDYDYVVLDTPPIIPVVDPMVIAQIVDAMVYVIRWEKTPRETVEAALKKFRATGKIAGVAVTQVNLRRQARYGYSEPGYYYSQYRSYYSD